MSVALWHPCSDGAPDPENCPDCLVAGKQPPAALRCPETWPRWGSLAPCRVLGPHEVHTDGRGFSWRPLIDRAAIDVEALPPWPCCAASGEHRLWCEHHPSNREDP
jgi:hypothetical protein